MGSVKLKDLKAYVRYDGSGRVVAGSLVFRKKKPKNGRWVEIPKNLCCDGANSSSSTTTTTTQGGGGGVTPTAWIGYQSPSSLWGACNTPATTWTLYTNVNATPLPPGTGLYTDAALTTRVYQYQTMFFSINGYAYEVINGYTNPLTAGVLCSTVTTCPTLGRAANFGVLAASTVTNTGSTTIFGDLGLYPGTSVTGFPPGFVSGTQHVTDAAAQNAQLDAQAAFTAFNGLTPTGSLPASIGGGSTISPGIRTVSSSLLFTGAGGSPVLLDGQGNSNSVFVFLIPSTLTFNGSITLTNDAQAGNVYWIVGSSATIGVGQVVVGNIIAQASITVNTNGNLIGRAFALTAAVTLDQDTINSTGAVCTINPLA